MDELYTLVFTICAALLAAELISQLFPDQSVSMIRGLAAAAILVILVRGFLNLDMNLDFVQSAGDLSVAEENADTLYAETGSQLLRERLHSLLDTAGIKAVGGVDGVEVWYRQTDNDEIQIDRVRVCIVYSSDIDRAFALLRSVLTETIPIEVYTA